MAVSFAGAPIVLVRTKSNRLFALENRCAHRQIPLSWGTLKGDQLQCCYHGWVYSENGHFTIPYAPQHPVGIGPIHSYPMRDECGMLFIFPGNPKLAHSAPVPDLHESTLPEFSAIHFTRVVNCHYSFLHENFMDMSHQVVHRRWVGGFELQPVYVRSDCTDVEVGYDLKIEQSSLAMKLFLKTVGLSRPSRSVDTVDAATSAHHVSSRIRCDAIIATRYPYQTLCAYHPDSKELLLKLWMAYVPVDYEQKISHPCGMLIVRKPRVAWVVPALRQIFEWFANRIFDEDKLVMEAEQAAYDAQGSDWNNEILPFIMELRKILVANGIPMKSAACNTGIRPCASPPANFTEPMA